MYMINRRTNDIIIEENNSVTSQGIYLSVCPAVRPVSLSVTTQHDVFFPLDFLSISIY